MGARRFTTRPSARAVLTWWRHCWRTRNLWQSTSATTSEFLQHEAFTSHNKADGTGCTALHFAAKNGHMNVCSALLQSTKFTQPHAVDRNGQNALRYATKSVVAQNSTPFSPEEVEGAMSRHGVYELEKSPIMGTKQNYDSAAAKRAWGTYLRTWVHGGGQARKNIPGGRKNLGDSFAEKERLEAQKESDAKRSARRYSGRLERIAT